VTSLASQQLGKQEMLGKADQSALASCLNCELRFCGFISAAGGHQSVFKDQSKP
jgi:hypothetical protein